MAEWPGCYIPPLPSHKSFGNTDKNFVKQRCHLLDKFVKAVLRCPHIYNS